MGKARLAGDNVDTDQMYPTQYTSTSEPAEMAKHCMEGCDPDFLKRMKKGDMLVAGVNFGCGSSREHAPRSIQAAGFSCVIAKSFSRLFYRNSINIGLPIIVCEEAVDDCKEGDELSVDFGTGEIQNLSRKKKYQVKPFPDFVQAIMESGGLIEKIRAEMERQRE